LEHPKLIVRPAKNVIYVLKKSKGGKNATYHGICLHIHIGTEIDVSGVVDKHNLEMLLEVVECGCRVCGGSEAGRGRHPVTLA
jgi:hypothetical protein